MLSILLDNQFFQSAIIILAVLFVRWLLIRYLCKYYTDHEDSALIKRWQNYVNKVSSLIILLGIIIVWISEIRYFAISIAAFIVSFVIATREFIQCYIGSLYLTSTRLFHVGDWIRVGNQCGEVIDTDWISTRVLEVDVSPGSYAFTGKVLSIPNNQFVNNTVENISFMRHYVSHSFILVRDDEGFNVLDAQDVLLPKAIEYCEEFRDVAERYSQLLEKRLGVDFCELEPSMKYSTTNLGKNQFTFTIFCPREKANEIEQKITQDFFQYWYGALQTFEANKSEKKTNQAVISPEPMTSEQE